MSNFGRNDASIRQHEVMIMDLLARLSWEIFLLLHYEAYSVLFPSLVSIGLFQFAFFS